MSRIRPKLLVEQAAGVFKGGQNGRQQLLLSGRKV
jgi:hypothetical protein